MASEAETPIQTVGRRKTSVARAIVEPGKGEWSINGRALNEYFPRLYHQKRVEEPLEVAEAQGQFSIRIRVNGGGLTGQADAVRLAVARALVDWDEELRSPLRGRDLLTRDARKVERKKPGQPKARKRFQFSKR